MKIFLWPKDFLATKTWKSGGGDRPDVVGKWGEVDVMDHKDEDGTWSGVYKEKTHLTGNQMVQ